MCLFNPSTTMPISLRLLPLTSLISMQNCESHSKWFFSHIYHDKRTSDLTLLHWKQQRFSVKSRRTRKHNNFHTLRWGEGWKSGQEELETIDVRAERKRGSEEKKREWLTWIRLTRSFCCCTYITTPPPPPHTFTSVKMSSWSSPPTSSLISILLLQWPQHPVVLSFIQPQYNEAFCHLQKSHFVRIETTGATTSHSSRIQCAFPKQFNPNKQPLTHMQASKHTQMSVSTHTHEIRWEHVSA